MKTQTDLRRPLYSFWISMIFVMVLSLLPASLQAQAPRSFSYQAVARNADGSIMKDTKMDVRLTILQDSRDGKAVWTETQTVTTNAFGLFSVVAGSKTPLDLDWSAGPYYLKVETDLQDGAGWKDMGTVQILSVPYALQARSVGSLDQLKVQGNDLQTDSALFVVKRKDGQTVFAVYNDSIRMYVNASPTGKNPRGGFAIGGFGMNKGNEQDLMYISPDSVRIYTRQPKTKNPRGGFAIGSFGFNKGAVANFMVLTPKNYFIGHESGKFTSGLYNSFIGYQAGRSNTLGTSNSFIGYLSGYSNTTGSYNVFMGNNSGYSNINGLNNVCIGNNSGYKNTGDYNTFLGYYSGYSLLNSQNNVYIGYQAGRYATKGNYNVVMGSGAGYYNNGYYNVFIGYESGYNNVSGADNRYSKYNTFIGYQSGRGNTTGWQNLAIGYMAGLNNQTATNQFFIGNNAGQNLTKGYGNTFLGHYAGQLSTDCSNNTFLGYFTGRNNTTGTDNVYVGYASGSKSPGNMNIMIGSKAGQNNTGSGNIFLGYAAGFNETGSNKLYIDNSSTSTPLIWGDFVNNDVKINGDLTVTGTITGTLASSSDIRLKKDITAFTGALEKIGKIRAVEYYWDLDDHSNLVSDPSLQLGVIAQELQPVLPELVKKGPDGYLSVDYIKMTVVLLEAIKEQQKIIESQGREIDQLKNEKNKIAELEKTVKELREMMTGVAARR